MKHIPWTEEEKAAAKDTSLTSREVAARISRSRRAVIQWRQANLPKPQSSVKLTADKSPEEAVAEQGEKLWENRYARLQRNYNKLAQQAAFVEQLVAGVMEMAPKSYNPAPKIRPAVRCKAAQAQSAVLMLSDTHIGSVVSPEQTLGFGTYDFQSFLARLKFLETSIVSILREHTTTSVPELVVAMLGDMLHGNLAHNVEAGQQNTLFTQWFAGSHAIAQFLRNLAPHVPKLRVYTCVGNHTRWSNQKKMPTDNRYSNLDMFLYAMLQALTRDISTIEWNLNTQPFAEFRVQNSFFHASHGDHLRGGDKAMGVPTHAIGRAVSVTMQLHNKQQRQSPHYYLVGHLHRGISLPHALGDVLVNGGFPGIDGFGLMEHMNPTDPMQRFFFVHPEYGRTASYRLQLQHAQVNDEPPYEIPIGFPME